MLINYILGGRTGFLLKFKVVEGRGDQDRMDDGRLRYMYQGKIFTFVKGGFG